MKLVLLFIITFIFLPYSLSAFDVVLDTAKTIQVESIKITGNEITEEHIILRELDFKSGDIISEYQLSYNKERVFSLGIFNKVDFIVTNELGKNIVEIKIEEAWYIYPLPYLSLRENSFRRSTYGLAILYKNFRGRNETLWGVVTFGYDPTYSLSYYNPVLITGKKLTFGMKLGYTNIANKSIEAERLNNVSFKYNYIFGSVSIGYRFNQYNKISQTSMYEYIELPKNIRSLSASKEKIDRIYSLGFSYELDNRNLKQFSNDGTFASVIYLHKGLGINDISYNTLKVDLRKYNLIYGNLSAKWRGAFRNTFGSSIPFYALSLLGDSEYIRGHRFNKREGNNYFLTSFEVNYPIIKVWDFSLDLPVLPKKLTSARIGLYMNLFIDSGLTYNNGESPRLKNLDTGWGFGLTLLVLPYNAVRFEYAFNEFNKGEFIIESGFSF